MTKKEYIDRECTQRCTLHMHCGWRHSPELCPSMREFSKGYDAAVEEACEWLKANANKYIVDIGVGYEKTELVIGGACWADLKEAMEGKK